MEHPLISIITVTFNAESSIGLTMDSLNSQSFKDFEHIVIDGQSQDLTLEIIKRYNSPQTVIFSEKDKGLYDAMNKGLKIARGKYIIFINAGDRFHTPDSLRHYAEEALNDRDIIYGDTVIINSEGEQLGRRHLSTPAQLTKKSFLKGMLICHQAFMVKKELTSPYDLSYKFSADYDWCVKCINKSDINNCINLNEVTIDYLSAGLTDKNKIKSLIERFRIMAKHYGYVSTGIRHIGFVFRALKRGNL